MVNSGILSKIRSKLPKSQMGYFLMYTAVFCIVSLIVYWEYLSNGLTFVWSGEEYTRDGYAQHYKALMYFGMWCREIITNLFSQGELVIPMWDFSIGYGSDIITSMHYYAYGDPLSLFSIVVPTQYTELLYDFLVILRLYLAGIAFSLFCFKMNRGKMAVFAGTFAYLFSGYTIYAGTRHPFFLNPLIYLPLMLWGAEKIFRKESPLLFISMAFISAVSNFYFFYMIVIAVVIYILIRYFTMERERSGKDFFLSMLKFAGSGLLGVGMAALIFLPAVGVLFGSERLQSAGTGFSLFYSIGYYETILANFFSAMSNPDWTCLGWAAPCFASIVVMFSTKKKYKGLKIGFCLFFGMILFPIVGKVMNGFSYVNNRWTFMFTLLIAFILTSVWDDMFALSKKKMLLLGGSGIAYMLLLLIFRKAVSKSTGIAVALIFATIIVLCLANCDCLKKYPKSLPSLVLIFLVLVSCCANSYFRCSPDEGNYVEEYPSLNSCLKQIQQSSDKAAASLVDDEAFSRNEQNRSVNANASAITGARGVQFFWSLENGNIAKFFSENCFANFLVQKYSGLNSRAYLDALASVKYFVEEGKGNVPYGFEYLKTKKYGKNKYKIYENQYALPLGYTYSTYITEEEYLEMNPAQKQQAMLQGVVLTNGEIPENIDKAQVEYSHQERDFEISLGKYVVRQEDGSYLVNKEGAKMTLTFDGIADSETYFYTDGVDFEPRDKYELYNDDCQEYYSQKDYNKKSTLVKNKLKKKNFYQTETDALGKNVFGIKVGDAPYAQMGFYSDFFKYSTGQDEFFVNLGYNKKAQTEITIKFPNAGVYSFEEMKVICQPMANYVEQVKALKEDVMENEVISNNRVEGEITLSEDKLLCLSIPYTTGWTATVDGKKTELLQANTMYMALPLTPGTHKIVLTYKTPLITVGLAITLISFAVFIAIAITCVVKSRKKCQQIKVK